MNILIDNFPETVKVNGKDYPVETDFREWIRFTKLVEDEDVPWQIKCHLLMQWYIEDIPDDLEGAINALGDFLAMKQEDDEQESDAPVKPPKQVYSFDRIWFGFTVHSGKCMESTCRRFHICTGGSSRRYLSDFQTVQRLSSASCTGTRTSEILRTRMRESGLRKSRTWLR